MRPAALLVAVVAVLALAGRDVFAHGGDPQQIHACVDNSTGEVIVIADPTLYGNPRARCPRPEIQHALDWNIQGPPGPAGAQGPLGQGGSQEIRVQEYERKLAVLESNQEINVASLAIVGYGVYAVQAKVTAAARFRLGVRCRMLVFPSADASGDVSTASSAHLDGNLFDPTQTMYLQEVYRFEPPGRIRSLRVRCKRLLEDPAVSLTDISIQALILPYSPN